MKIQQTLFIIVLIFISCQAKQQYNSDCLEYVQQVGQHIVDFTSNNPLPDSIVYLSGEIQTLAETCEQEQLDLACTVDQTKDMLLQLAQIDGKSNVQMEMIDFVKHIFSECGEQQQQDEIYSEEYETESSSDLDNDYDNSTSEDESSSDDFHELVGCSQQVERTTSEILDNASTIKTHREYYHYLSDLSSQSGSCASRLQRTDPSCAGVLSNIQSTASQIYSALNRGDSSSTQHGFSSLNSEDRQLKSKC